MKNHYDALIIGAGPAGTSAASVLAAQGWKTLILEKEKFPRYHVGESLLPFCYFTFERIGMLDKLQNSEFVKKYSVQFVSTRGNLSEPFYFFQHMDHPAAKTWQVTRSDFDQMLLENAKERGAECREETRVTNFIEEDNCVVGIQAETKEGESLEFRAPMTIDASGLGSLGVKKHQWRVNDKSLNKVAVWTYYKGAKRDSGYDEGATTVAYLPEKGWFWYIPLQNDIVSVGIVAEPSYLYRDGRDPQKMFAREIENNPWIKDHLEPGEQVGDYHATGDYSYRSQYCAKDGLVLTGDAFAFLDPVFSSGVFLALRGGELAGETVAGCLRDQVYTADRFQEYGQHLCNGIESMRKLVYAFYDQGFRFGDLLEKYPDLHCDLTDCLIGNLNKDFNPLFNAIAEFADVPQPLKHGLPRVAQA